MMDTFDERLDDAARALGQDLPDLPDSLDDRIMAALKKSPSRQVAKSTGPLRWLMEPRPIRVRPVWVPIGLAAAAALVLWLTPRPLATGRLGDLATGATQATRDTVYVHFALNAPSARNVSLAGSFNNWDAAGLSLHRGADGSWEATIALPVGEHRYQFVVDGQRWIPDPSAQAQIEDGFGGTNSVIVVGPKGVIRS